MPIFRRRHKNFSLEDIKEDFIINCFRITHLRAVKVLAYDTMFLNPLKGIPSKFPVPFAILGFQDAQKTLRFELKISRIEKFFFFSSNFP